MRRAGSIAFLIVIVATLIRVEQPEAHGHEISSSVAPTVACLSSSHDETSVGRSLPSPPSHGQRRCSACALLDCVALLSLSPVSGATVHLGRVAAPVRSPLASTSVSPLPDSRGPPRV